MCLFIETIRIENGLACNLEYHNCRCNRTREAFFGKCIPIDLQPFVAAAASSVALSGIWKCRIVYGREVEDVACTPYCLREVNSLQMVVSDSVDYTYKSICREELNALYDRRGKADDILVVRNGLLTDTSIANIALYDGNRWVTPAAPLLRGTRRAELLDKSLLVEKDIPYTSVGDYSHVRLFNALIEWGRIELPTGSISEPV